MPINLIDIQSFADADILSILRQALVNSVIAKEYTLNGRSVASYDPAQIQRLIGVYEWRISRANGGGMFTAGQFRRHE